MESTSGQDPEGFSPMRAARAGRRAGRTAAVDFLSEGPSVSSGGQEPAADPNETLELPTADDEPTSSSNAGQPAAASGRLAAEPPAGEGGAFLGVSKRKQQQMQKQAEVASQARSKYDKMATQEMMEIPEVEEQGKENLTFVVAAAPKSNTGATLAADLVQLAQADQGWRGEGGPAAAGLDLSLLTACLLPSAEVEEPDEVWDMNLVFTSVKAALQAEADPNSVAAAGGHQDPGALEA